MKRLMFSAKILLRALVLCSCIGATVSLYAQPIPLGPILELQALAQLPLSELKKPANKKALLRASRQVAAVNARDSGRKSAAAAAQAAPETTLAMHEITAEFRSKLTP